MPHGQTCKVQCANSYEQPSPNPAICWHGKITYTCYKDCPTAEIVNYIEVFNPRYQYVDIDRDVFSNLLNTEYEDGTFDKTKKNFGGANLLKAHPFGTYYGNVTHGTKFMLRCNQTFVNHVDGELDADQNAYAVCEDGVFKGPWDKDVYYCGMRDCDPFDGGPYDHWMFNELNHLNLNKLFWPLETITIRCKMELLVKTIPYYFDVQCVNGTYQGLKPVCQECPFGFTAEKTLQRDCVTICNTDYQIWNGTNCVACPQGFLPYDLYNCGTCPKDEYPIPMTTQDGGKGIVCVGCPPNTYTPYPDGPCFARQNCSYPEEFCGYSGKHDALPTPYIYEQLVVRDRDNSYAIWQEKMQNQFYVDASGGPEFVLDDGWQDQINFWNEKKAKGVANIANYDPIAALSSAEGSKNSLKRTSGSIVPDTENLHPNLNLGQKHLALDPSESCLAHCPVNTVGKPSVWTCPKRNFVPLLNLNSQFPGANDTIDEFEFKMEEKHGKGSGKGSGEGGQFFDRVEFREVVDKQRADFNSLDNTASCNVCDEEGHVPDDPLRYFCVKCGENEVTAVIGYETAIRLEAYSALHSRPTVVEIAEIEGQVNKHALYWEKEGLTSEEISSAKSFQAFNMEMKNALMFDDLKNTDLYDFYSPRNTTTDPFYVPNKFELKPNHKIICASCPDGYKVKVSTKDVCIPCEQPLIGKNGKCDVFCGNGFVQEKEFKTSCVCPADTYYLPRTGVDYIGQIPKNPREILFDNMNLEQELKRTDSNLFSDPGSCVKCVRNLYSNVSAICAGGTDVESTKPISAASHWVYTNLELNSIAVNGPDILNADRRGGFSDVKVEKKKLPPGQERKVVDFVSLVDFSSPRHSSNLGAYNTEYYFDLERDENNNGVESAPLLYAHVRCWNWDPNVCTGGVVSENGKNSENILNSCGDLYTGIECKICKRRKSYRSFYKNECEKCSDFYMSITNFWHFSQLGYISVALFLFVSLTHVSFISKWLEKRRMRNERKAEEKEEERKKIGEKLAIENGDQIDTQSNYKLQLVDNRITDTNSDITALTDYSISTRASKKSRYDWGANLEEEKKLDEISMASFATTNSSFVAKKMRQMRNKFLNPNKINVLDEVKDENDEDMKKERLEKDKWKKARFLLFCHFFHNLLTTPGPIENTYNYFHLLAPPAWFPELPKTIASPWFDGQDVIEAKVKSAALGGGHFSAAAAVVDASANTTRLLLQSEKISDEGFENHDPEYYTRFLIAEGTTKNSDEDSLTHINTPLFPFSQYGASYFFQDFPTEHFQCGHEWHRIVFFALWPWILVKVFTFWSRPSEEDDDENSDEDPDVEDFDSNGNSHKSSFGPSNRQKQKKKKKRRKKADYKIASNDYDDDDEFGATDGKNHTSKWLLRILWLLWPIQILEILRIDMNDIDLFRWFGSDLFEFFGSEKHSLFGSTKIVEEIPQFLTDLSIEYTEKEKAGRIGIGTTVHFHWLDLFSIGFYFLLVFIYVRPFYKYLIAKYLAHLNERYISVYLLRQPEGSVFLSKSEKERRQLRAENTKSYAFLIDSTYKTFPRNVTGYLFEIANYFKITCLIIFSQVFLARVVPTVTAFTHMIIHGGFLIFVLNSSPFANKTANSVEALNSIFFIAVNFYLSCGEERNPRSSSSATDRSPFFIAHYNTSDFLKNSFGFYSVIGTLFGILCTIFGYLIIRLCVFFEVVPIDKEAQKQEQLLTRKEIRDQLYLADSMEKQLKVSDYGDKNAIENKYSISGKNSAVLGTIAEGDENDENAEGTLEFEQRREDFIKNVDFKSNIIKGGAESTKKRRKFADLFVRNQKKQRKKRRRDGISPEKDPNNLEFDFFSETNTSLGQSSDAASSVGSNETQGRLRKIFGSMANSIFSFDWLFRQTDLKPPTVPEISDSEEEGSEKDSNALSSTFPNVENDAAVNLPRGISKIAAASTQDFPEEEGPQAFDYTGFSFSGSEFSGTGTATESNLTNATDQIVKAAREASGEQNKKDELISKKEKAKAIEKMAKSDYVIGKNTNVGRKGWRFWLFSENKAPKPLNSNQPSRIGSKEENNIELPKTKAEQSANIDFDDTFLGQEAENAGYDVIGRPVAMPEQIKSLDKSPRMQINEEKAISPSRIVKKPVGSSNPFDWGADQGTDRKGSHSSNFLVARSEMSFFIVFWPKIAVFWYFFHFLDPKNRFFFRSDLANRKFEHSSSSSADGPHDGTPRGGAMANLVGATPEEQRRLEAMRSKDKARNAEENNPYAW